MMKGEPRMTVSSGGRGGEIWKRGGEDKARMHLHAGPPLALLFSPSYVNSSYWLSTHQVRGSENHFSLYFMGFS